LRRTWTERTIVAEGDVDLRVQATSSAAFLGVAEGGLKLCTQAFVLGRI
jgi:hypothetical protein